MEPEHRKLKVVMLGDNGVGKSSILMKLTQNIFDKQIEATLCAAYVQHIIQISSSLKVVLDIWDTAGQEKYQSVGKIYYRNADIAVCVYDMTNEGSFEKVKYWVKQLKQHGPKEVCIAIISNKVDLIKELRVTGPTGMDFARQIGGVFFFTSAKFGGTNFHKMFLQLSMLALSPDKEKRIQQGNKMIDVPLKRRKRRCC